MGAIAASSSRKGGDFLPQLQVGRFIAASMVMVGHLQYEMHDRGIATTGWLVDFKPVVWGSGVDIFFVISGFIMYFLSSSRFAEPGYPATFLRRRLVRIVPLYWAFLTLMLVAISSFGSRIEHSDLHISHILASYTFVPWPRSDGNVVPLLSGGWTLNFEMLFYFCFAVALIFPKRVGIAGLFLLFLTGAAMHAFLPHSWFALYFWTRSILLEFLLGILLAHIYLRGVRLTLLQGLLVLSLGAVLLASHRVLETYIHLPRVLGFGVPALLICAGLVLMPAPEKPGLVYRAVVLGGDASYALYLSHAFTINLILIAWIRFGLKAPLLFFLLAAAVATGVAIGIYRLIELPTIRRLNGFFKPRPAQMARAEQF